MFNGYGDRGRGRQRGIKEQIKKGRNYWIVDNLDYKRRNQDGKQPKGRPSPSDAGIEKKKRGSFDWALSLEKLEGACLS